MRMGSDASLSELLDKLEGIYGILEVGDSLMAQFYNAKQKDGENVNEFGCRLEELLDRAKKSGEFEEKDPNKKLCHFFWKGLHQYLKDANGHKYDQINNFDILRKEIRRSEIDHKMNDSEKVKKDKRTHAHTVDVAVKRDQAQSSEIKNLIKDLNTKFDNLHCEVQQVKKGVESKFTEKPNDKLNLPSQANQYPSMPCYNSVSPGYGYSSQPQLFNQCPSAPKMTQNYRQPMRTNHFVQRPFYTYGPRQTVPTYQNRYNTQTGTASDPRICWNCGQTGHLKQTCNIRTDHLRQGNYYQPVYKGNAWV